MGLTFALALGTLHQLHELGAHLDELLVLLHLPLPALPVGVGDGVAEVVGLERGND